MILGLSALLVASPNALLFLFLPFIGLAKGLETRVLSSPRGVWCHQPAELERAALLFFSCLWNEISRSWIHTISTQQKIQNIFSATHINAGQDNLCFSNAKCANTILITWSGPNKSPIYFQWNTKLETIKYGIPTNIHENDCMLLLTWELPSPIASFVLCGL